MVPHLQEAYICGMSSRLRSWKICQIFSVNAKQHLFSLFYFAIVSCLVLFGGLNDWNLKKQDTCQLKQFKYIDLANRVISRMWKNHTQLQPPPHAGHTLLWDGIPSFNQLLLQVSQRGCIGHCGTNSMPKLIPQVFSGVEVWTAGRPSHPLHSQILEEVSNKPPWWGWPLSL